MIIGIWNLFSWCNTDSFYSLSVPSQIGSLLTFVNSDSSGKCLKEQGKVFLKMFFFWDVISSGSRGQFKRLELLVDGLDLFFISACQSLFSSSWCFTMTSQSIGSLITSSRPRSANLIRQVFIVVSPKVRVTWAILTPNIAIKRYFDKNDIFAKVLVLEFKIFSNHGHLYSNVHIFFSIHKKINIGCKIYFYRALKRFFFTYYKHI